jgi:deoxyribonuclease-4
MNSLQRAELKKLLPSNTKLPEFPAAKIPSGIISALPKGESYSLLGCTAEEMLRLPSSEIDVEGLLTLLKLAVPTLDETKIRKSTTTQPFLDSLIATRKKLEAVFREDGELKYEEEVVWGSVAGHPDMWNKTQVFEVKCSGELNNPMKKSALWTSFLFQLFAYGSLMSEVTDLYLVLPLQKEVVHYDIRKWEKRKAFRDYMVNWSSTEQTVGVEKTLEANLLIHECGIGCHTHKCSSLEETVRSVPDVTKPYQIFLSGPQNSNMNVKDADLAKTRAIVEQTGQQIFVHSQYIINLCSTDKDNFAAKLLSKNLDAAKAAGFKGVVVHVGKSTTQPIPQAIEKMRSSLMVALDHASTDCPLLLETPAGQGTELLTEREEFLDFVSSFNDERIRVCIDTCHVFAAGHNPLEYIQEALKRPGLVKLIHYNDSLEACGACKDRHAFVGQGHIGFAMMREIAYLCVDNELPMVIE